MRLAVPDLISNSYFPAIAAVEMGYLADAGYDIEVELLFPVSKAMVALKDGDVDFVAGAAHATLSAFPQWSGASLLAAVSQHMYWFLVVRADLNVRRGEVGGIKGLRIGAAPGVDVGLLQLLRDAGIDPDADRVRIGPVPGLGEGSVSFGVNAAKALREGLIDGFWANGMGAEVAVREGIGSVVLDIRRGDGPPGARHYTFPALVTTDDVLMTQPELAAAAVRGLVRAQQSLREDSERATGIGRKLFPPTEAALIAELIARDAPYYDPTINEDTVIALNRFSRETGLLFGDAAYEDVVALEMRTQWSILRDPPDMGDGPHNEEV
ncbi:MAG: ABC transporter substrate-binding protein [Actinomycetota bacterium]